MILIFGRTEPRFERVFSELSALDWIAIYGFACILVVSMKHLLCLRKKALAWFSTYVGLGSWAALLYSFSPSEKPHYDELASLTGLLLALLVLAYILKLKRDEILK